MRLHLQLLVLNLEVQNLTLLFLKGLLLNLDLLGDDPLKFVLMPLIPSLFLLDFMGEVLGDDLIF